MNIGGLNMDNLNVVDGLNQRQVYEEFKKYCKLSSETINEYGVRTLHVTNGNPDPYYAMDIEFIPKESPLETVDRIFVPGFDAAGFTLESLLRLGYERLGAEAFNTREQVETLNEQIRAMAEIKTSSHTR